MFSYFFMSISGWESPIEFYPLKIEFCIAFKEAECYIKSKKISERERKK